MVLGQVDVAFRLELERALWWKKPRENKFNPSNEDHSYFISVLVSLGNRLVEGTRDWPNPRRLII